MRYKIYALADPANPKVPKYIGQTVQELYQRLAGHWNLRTVYVDHPKVKWIESLRSKGMKPVIYLLEQVETAEEANIRETHWIRFFRPLGSLLNRSDGKGTLGMKLGPPSEANRRATKERNRHGLSFETRSKISATLTGRKMSEEAKLKLRNHPSRKVVKQLFEEANAKRKKPVIQVLTGECFESTNAAARHLGVHENAVRAAVKGGWRCRGSHWIYKEVYASNTGPI